MNRNCTAYFSDARATSVVVNGARNCFVRVRCTRMFVQLLISDYSHDRVALYCTVLIEAHISAGVVIIHIITRKSVRWFFYATPKSPWQSKIPPAELLCVWSLWILLLCWMMNALFWNEYMPNSATFHSKLCLQRKIYHFLWYLTLIIALVMIPLL